MDITVMIKVAYITDAVGMGGGETSLVYHLEACLSSGLIEPVLVCPEGEVCETARQRGINVYVLPIRSLRGGFRGMVGDYLFTALRLRHAIRRLHVQAIHAESIVALCHLLPTLLTTRIPAFLTWHGFGTINSRLVTSLFRKRLAKVFAVSVSAASSAVPLARANDIVRLPLAVRATYLGSALKDRNVVLNELSLPISRPIILQLARFQEIKGQLTLLSVYEQARDSGHLQDAILVFVGGVLSGSDHAASDYYDQVKREACASKYADDIFFRPFQVDILSLLKAVSILVIPSRYESFGMVAIEAMAAEVPVLATKAGGLTDIITHGHDGLLVDVNNQTMFCHYLHQLISDPALAGVLACNGKRTVSERYLPQDRVQTLSKYYSEKL